MSQLIDRLAHIAEGLTKYQLEIALDGGFRVAIVLSSGERWIITPGMPPEKDLPGKPVDATIELTSSDAEERFASGTSHPQKEALTGEWVVSGVPAITMAISQLFAEVQEGERQGDHAGESA